MGSWPRSGALVCTAVAVGFLTMSTAEAMAQARAVEEANRTVVARSFKAWAAGTGSPYDLLADDASWTITGNSAGAKTYPTRTAFIDEVIRPFNARMRSRLIPRIRRLYAENDTVIAFFDAAGTARDGQPYTNTYVWILEMSGGKIVRAYAFFDSIAFDDLWRRVSPAEGYQR